MTRDLYADLEQVYFEETAGAAVDKGLLTPRLVDGQVVRDRKTSRKPSIDERDGVGGSGRN